jgi:5-methylcytosine-specific restriction endonuclease McrA
MPFESTSSSRRVNLLHAHGSPTRYRYRYLGCRCTACRAANAQQTAAYAEYYREYRASHRGHLRQADRDYYASHKEEKRVRNALYRATHQEQIAENQARYRELHREEAKIATREWVASNPARKVAADADWRARNQERCALNREQWRRENPDKMATYRRNIRARRRGAEGSHTASEEREQLARQSGKCFYCGIKLAREKHLDHVMPLCLGGTNYIANLVWTCPTCNWTKHAKHPMDFAGILL